MDPNVIETLDSHQFLLQEMSAGNAVLFCGAGVSLGRYPDWNRLTRDLAAEIGLRTKGSDNLDLPQWYVEAVGRKALEQRLVHLFSAPAQPTALQRILARFAWDVVFTTNYDQLLEHSLQEQGREVDVVVEDMQVGRVTERSRTTLVKMHGCVSRPHSLVVTREDYDAYDRKHPAIITYLQSLLSTRTFLFVGFSLRDPNFRNIYRIVQQVLGSFRRYAYAILLEESVNDYVLQYWRRQRLLILPLSGPRQIRQFMRGAQEQATRWAVRQQQLPTILDGLGPACGDVKQRLDSLAEAVDQVSHRIGLPLLPEIRERGDDAETSHREAMQWSRTTSLEREQLYSLHNLLQLMEEIGVIVPAQRWLRLGNTLYELEKWDLALLAYQRVYGRMAQGEWEDSGVPLKEIAGDMARCYLSVAQQRLAAFRRIATGEKVVLDLAEYEWAEGHLSRCIRTPEGKLDSDWLLRRPSDLAEYGYANNRLAEIEITRGQLNPARSRLRSAVGWQEEGVELYRQVMSGYPLAFALNHLGKAQRLRTEVALAQSRMDSASRHFARARQWFIESIDAAPGLGFPFGHLFDLLRLVAEKGLEETLGIRVQEERSVLRLRVDALDDERGRQVQLFLRTHYPEVWQSPGRSEQNQAPEASG